MLSHHRTNGLWDFYSPPKSGNGKKRCQLACDLSLLFCAFFNKCRPPRFTPSKAAGKQLVSERQNANMTKSKRAWDQDKVPHVLGWGPKPRFGVWSESKKGRASCLIPPFTPPPSLLFFYFFKVGLPYLRRTYAVPTPVKKFIHVAPTWQGGQLCCQESEAELWVTVHPATYTPSAKLFPVHRLRAWLWKEAAAAVVVMVAAMVVEGGIILTSCCPLLVSTCNCSPLSFHLKGSSSSSRCSDTMR